MDAGHLGLKNQLLLVREHYHWDKNFCDSLGQWDRISSWSKHKKKKKNLWFKTGHGYTSGWQRNSENNGEESPFSHAVLILMA